MVITIGFTLTGCGKHPTGTNLLDDEVEKSNGNELEDDLGSNVQNNDQINEDFDLFMTFAEIPSGDYVGRAESDWENAPHSWFSFDNESGLGGSGYQFYIYANSGDLISGNIDIVPELVTGRDIDNITIEGSVDGISYKILFFRDGTAKVNAFESRTGLKISDTYHLEGGASSEVNSWDENDGRGGAESPFSSYEGVTFTQSGHGYDGTTVTVSLSGDETVFTLHYMYSIDDIVFDDVIRVKNTEIKNNGDFYEITKVDSDSGIEYQMMFGYESIRITSMMISGMTPDGKDIYINTVL